LQNKILHILKYGEFNKSAIAEKIGHKVVSGEKFNEDRAY